MKPVDRVEAYLLAILNGTNDYPMPPVTRFEIYLAKIAGADVVLPSEPKTRVELYLAKIAGEDVEVPEPKTRFEWFLNEWANGGPATELVEVTGVSPLELANAIGAELTQLIQYGLCEQDETPTPDAPVDIKCNNGTLKMVDDELPLGYKRLVGISFDGDFHYETGESLTGDDDVTMTLDNTSTQGQNVFGSYNGTSSGTKNFSLFIYGSTSTSGSYLRYGDQLLRPRLGSGERTITFGKSGTDGFLSDASATPDTFTTPANAYIGMLPNSTSPAYTGDILGNIFVGTRLKWIPCERESDNAIGYYEAVKGNFIAPSGTGTPTSLGYDGTHYERRVVGTPEVLTVSGAHDSRLPRGYTPCEYISASGTDEYINTGIVINAIGTDVEVDFKYDGEMTGTPKMLWGYMGSSSNLPRWGFGVYSSKWLGSPNGTASVGTADNTDRHMAVMRVFRTSNDTEVYSGTMDGTELYASNNLGNVSLFTANTLPLILFGRNNNGTAGNLAETKIYGFKVTENGTVTHELVPCLNAESKAGFYDLITREFHGNEGTTPLGYAIKYTPDGTASVVDLFAVGDFADEQEIISGAVKRKVGVWVLTGEESWMVASTNSDVYYLSSANLPDDYGIVARFTPICSHLEGILSTVSIASMGANTIKTNNSSKIVYACVGATYMTKEAWKAFVAEQYAAGTPVIVIYPLAEEVSEQVTPQRLSTADGTNAVSATAEVSPIAFDVIYTKLEE